MRSPVKKNQPNKSQSAAANTQLKEDGNTLAQFKDHRPDSDVQRQLQQVAKNNSQPSQLTNQQVAQAKVIYGKDFQNNHVVDDGVFTDQQAALKTFLRSKRNTILKNGDLTESNVTSGTDKPKSDTKYTLSKELTVPSITAASKPANKYDISKFKKVHLEGFVEGSDKKLTHLNGTSDADGGVSEITVNFNDPAQLAQKAVTTIYDEIKAEKGYVDPLAIKGSEDALDELETEMYKYEIDLTEDKYSTHASLAGAGIKANIMKAIATDIKSDVEEYNTRLAKIMEGTKTALEREWEDVLTKPDEYEPTQEEYKDNFAALWDESKLEAIEDVDITYDESKNLSVDTSGTNVKIDALKKLIEKIKLEYGKLPEKPEEEEAEGEGDDK